MAFSHIKKKQRCFECHGTWSFYYLCLIGFEVFNVKYKSMYWPSPLEFPRWHLCSMITISKWGKLILGPKIHSLLGIVTITFLNHTTKYAHCMIIVEWLQSWSNTDYIKMINHTTHLWDLVIRGIPKINELYIEVKCTLYTKSR